MSDSRLIIAAFALVVAAACGGNEPPAVAEPPGPTPEEIEQMRQDSIRRAEAERRAQEAAEAERVAREEARRVEMARETLAETVYFDYDAATIRADAEAMLREKVDILRRNPGVELRMEGHADERGTSEYNVALGNERAESVIRFISGFGLDASRFSAVSYGEARPVAPGGGESAWARNRRVEFVVTAGGDDIVP